MAPKNQREALEAAIRAYDGVFVHVTPDGLTLVADAELTVLARPSVERAAAERHRLGMDAAEAAFAEAIA